MDNCLWSLSLSLFLSCFSSSTENEKLAELRAEHVLLLDTLKVMRAEMKKLMPEILDKAGQEIDAQCKVTIYELAEALQSSIEHVNTFLSQNAMVLEQVERIAKVNQKLPC